MNKNHRKQNFTVITNWGGGDYQLRSVLAAKQIWVAVITIWGTLDSFPRWDNTISTGCQWHILVNCNQLKWLGEGGLRGPQACGRRHIRDRVKSRREYLWELFMFFNYCIWNFCLFIFHLSYFFYLNYFILTIFFSFELFHLNYFFSF